MKELTTLIIAALTALAANTASACGRDFFLCDPSSTPPGGATLLLPVFKWDRHDGEDEFEASLGIVHPFHPRVAFDGYFSFADEGGGWEMETVTPGLLFDLTPDMENSPVRFGLFTAYKFAVNGGDDEEFISANQLDARDQFESRFIVETNVTEELGLVFNLLTTVYEGKARWGYATGVRYEFSEEVGGSVEAIGDFQDNGKHQVFANLWWEPTEGIVLRVGAGAGLTERAEDFTLLSGLVFEF
ncbi:MAG: hypothetical protein ABL974_13260 [Prosthecobacter sp.]